MLAKLDLASPKDLGGATLYRMEVNELKKLINNSTAVLVLDNGEPLFVILGYKMYKDLVSDHGVEKEITINPVRSLARDKVASPEDLGEATSNGINHAPNISNGSISIVRQNSLQQDVHNFHEKEAEILERLNKEILALKNQIEMEEKELSSQGID